MFLTQRILGLVAQTKDDAYAVALAALHQARELAVSAKQAEIARLDAQISDLKEELRYEKKRGDTLVDRLLQKEARIAAVAPVAEHVVKHQDAEAVKRLKVVFDEINSMDAHIPPVSEGRAFEMAGGTKVEA